MKWIILIGIIILSGCSSSTYYDDPIGIVEHNNSLQEAFNECSYQCSQKYQWSINKRATPVVKECTEKECMCIC